MGVFDTFFRFFLIFMQKNLEVPEKSIIFAANFY